jgi:hypothetical protein
VKSKGVVDLGHHRLGHCPEPSPDPFDCDGSNLLGLRLRVARQTSELRSQQDLERVDPIRRRCDRDHGDYTAAEPSRSCIGPVITDDDSWAPPVCFGAADGVEINETDLPSEH